MLGGETELRELVAEVDLRTSKVPKGTGDCDGCRSSRQHHQVGLEVGHRSDYVVRRLERVEEPSMMPEGAKSAKHVDVRPAGCIEVWRQGVCVEKCDSQHPS